MAGSREVLLTANISPGIYLSFHGASVVPVEVGDVVLYPFIVSELADRRAVKELERASSKRNAVVLVNRDDGISKINRAILDTLFALSKNYPVLIPPALIEEVPQIGEAVLGIIRYVDPELLEKTIRSSEGVLRDMCEGSMKCVESIINLVVHHGASHASMLRIPLGLTQNENVLVEEFGIYNYGLNRKYITTEVLPKYRMRYLLALRLQVGAGLAERATYIPKEPVLFIPVSKEEPEEAVEIIKSAYPKNVKEKNGVLYCSFL